MGRRKEWSRGELIRHLWPDKGLYGAVILFVTGLMGIVFGLVAMTVDIDYSDTVPRFLADFPPWVTILCSGMTVVFAYLSLRHRDTQYALFGAIAGILSLGLLGVSPLLSLIALGYVALAKREKEDTTLATLQLTADMWPDKSLAASLLMLITGVTTASWGVALVTDTIHLEFGGIEAFGWAVLLVGLVCLFASLELYLQRGLWIGILAAVGGICAVGFYGVGSLLSLACLVLLILAAKEDEFRKPHAQPEAAPARPAARR